jgi:adenosylmethionine-8-amino-7-oxononanoate aminotransferase
MTDTRDLVTLDRRHFWHPFTQMSSWIEDEDVVVIESGKGCWLVDTEGRRYLDGVSSLWCNLHGHRVEAIDDAVRDQLDRIAHSTTLGLTSVPAARLAGRLASIAPPGLGRIFYSDSGATAVEAALKIAFQYHAQTGAGSRTRFAALGSAYHGDTVGSVSLGGIESMHGMFAPLRFEVVRIPTPDCLRCPLGLERASCALGCADEAVRILEEHAPQLAGLVVEPLVQGAAGMIVQPGGYLSRLAAACGRLGILLVADEVATGFGRTGTLFACTQEDVRPDLMCLAKGLTGGYLPVAATLATEEIFSAFLGTPASGRAFLHGHTYTGNPLGCAAALASLDLLEPMLETLPARAERFGALLDPLADLEHVVEIRRRGFMVGIEVMQDPASRTPYPPERRTGHRIIREARSRGVIIRPLGDVVVLNPPLSISDEEMELLVRVTGESIAAVTEER